MWIVFAFIPSPCKVSTLTSEVAVAVRARHGVHELKRDRKSPILKKHSLKAAVFSFLFPLPLNEYKNYVTVHISLIMVIYSSGQQ
jgi:hypothetical protein